MHFWRGFFVYAAVSIVPPIVPGFLSVTDGGMANVHPQFDVRK